MGSFCTEYDIAFLTIAILQLGEQVNKLLIRLTLSLVGVGLMLRLKLEAGVDGTKVHFTKWDIY